jgi:WD40 repeat protein
LSATVLFILFLGVTLLMLQRTNDLKVRENTIRYQNEMFDMQARDLQRQKFYLDIIQLRETRQRGVLDWRTNQLDKLMQLSLKEQSVGERALLKQEWVETLRSVDIHEEQSLVSDRQVYRCKWTNSGTQLVAGMTMSDEGEVSLMVFNDNPLRLKLEIKLPTPSQLNVGDSKSDGVRSMLFTEDQRTLWVGTRRGLLHEVDIERGEVLRSKLCHDAALFGLALDEERREIITGGSDYKLRVWDLKSLEEKQSFVTEYEARGLVRWKETLFVCAYQFLSSKHDGMKWSEPVALGIEFPAFPSTLSDDTSLVYQASADGYRFLSRDSLLLARQFLFSGSQTDPKFTNAHNIVASNERLLFTTDSNGLKMWDLVTGKLIGTLAIANNENAGVACRPDGAKIVVWGGGKLATYEVQKNNNWHSSPAQAYPVDSFFVRSREAVGTMGVLTSSRSIERGRQTEEYVVTYYPWEEKENRSRTAFENGPLELCGSSASLFFAHEEGANSLVCGDWNLNAIASRYPIRSNEELCVHFASSQNLLFFGFADRSTSRSTRVRFVPELVAIHGLNGEVKWRYRPITSYDVASSFTIKAMDTVSDRLYLLCDDQQIRELDIGTGKELRVMSVQNSPNAKICTLDSEWIVLGGNDGHIGVLSRETGQVIYNKFLHEAQVTAIASLEPGIIVTGASDGDLVVSQWNGTDLIELLRVPHPDTAIDRIQVTDDGNRICYLCRNEYAVRYLDWKELLKILDGI